MRPEHSRKTHALRRGDIATMSTHANGRIRAVVTGMGALSALGNSADELWSGLKAGRSGIAPLTQVETENYPCKIGGEVRGYDPTTVIDRREARRMGRFSLLAGGAAREGAGQPGPELVAGGESEGQRAVSRHTFQ